jgi:RNA polymerase sigma-70 factor, ECF subfamily
LPLSSGSGGQTCEAGMRTQVELEYSVFFDAEHGALLRMCWALTLDRELARDVAQETLTRAWRDWDRLGRVDLLDDGSLGPGPTAWCRTVALNLVRSNWRRRRTERSTELPLPEPTELAVRDLDLRDALARLSERQREAIVLHHLLDLPVQRCAELLGLAESTVKEHLQRGRAQLERHLTADPAGAVPCTDGRNPT